MEPSKHNNMANILIVGFEKLEAERLRVLIDAIMKDRGWANENESATVIADWETRWCDKKEPAPYLVVQHSKADMADKMGTVLHSILNLDTQIEVPHKYLASVPKSPQE